MASSARASTGRPSAASSAPASLAAGVAGSKPESTGFSASGRRRCSRQWRSKAQASQVLPMSVPVPVINCALIFPPPRILAGAPASLDMSDWLTRGLDHIWLPYTQMQTAPAPLPVVAAQGARIRLADGRELIDGISSWWTACHGYRHPHIRPRSRRNSPPCPMSCSPAWCMNRRLRLAARLAALLPGDLERVFFTESGSVAVEVALKMAIQYWRNKGQPEKQRIVYFRHGYHGDTFATMALCDPEEGMHALFAGSMPDQIMAELPADETMRRAFDLLLDTHRERLAAVIVEPLVQGAGGMKMHDAATLAFIAEACRRHGVLLIADEIMTGFGRTGRMFACEEANVVPDILCLSKALTGGTLPLAATVARRHVFAAFPVRRPGRRADARPDLHGQRPGLRRGECLARPLRARAAPGTGGGDRGAVARRTRTLPRHSRRRRRARQGRHRRRGAQRYDRPRRPAPALCPELGVWLRPFGRVLYLMPPFIVTPAELATLTAAVHSVLAERAEPSDGVAGHPAAQRSSPRSMPAHRRRRLRRSPGRTAYCATRAAARWSTLRPTTTWASPSIRW
jgi:adenosylmethionine-8-amino-7-oxononanoate aminotransferase